MQQRKPTNIELLLSNQATFKDHQLNVSLIDIINTPTFTTEIKFQALVDEYSPITRSHITRGTDDHASTNLNVNNNAANVDVEETHEQAISKEVLDNFTSMGIKAIIVDRTNNTALLQLTSEVETNYVLSKFASFNQAFQNKRIVLDAHFLENRCNLLTYKRNHFTQVNHFIKVHSPFKLNKNKSILDLLIAILVRGYSAVDIHFLFQIDAPKDQSYNPNLHEDKNVTDFFSKTIKGDIKIAYTKNVIKFFTDPNYPDDLKLIENFFTNIREYAKYITYEKGTNVKQDFRISYSPYVCTISFHQSNLTHSKTMLDFVINLFFSKKPTNQITTTMSSEQNQPTSHKRKRDDNNAVNLTNSPGSFFTPTSPSLSSKEAFEVISSEELEAAIKNDPELKRLLTPSPYNV